MKTSSRKKLVIALVPLLVFGGLLGIFYWSTQTQSGLKFTWGRFVRLIPGSLQWGRLDIDFYNQRVEIKNLTYSLSTGQRILELKSLHAQFRWDSLFRTRAIFKKLEIEGVTIDLSPIPPRKETRRLSPIFQSLSRRLGILESQFKDIKIITKNGFFVIPSGDLVYDPALIKKSKFNFNLTKVEGKYAEKPISIESIHYEGIFSLPGMIRKIFIFQEAEGKLTIRGAEWGPWKFSDLFTEVAFENETIDLKDLDLVIGKGVYHLKLKLNPFEQQLKGTLLSDGMVDASEIPGLTARLMRAYQKIGFTFEFDIVGFNPYEMKGSLSLNVKALGNQINPKVPTLSIQLASKVENGRLDLTQFNYTTERTRVSAKGYVDLRQKKLDTSLSGTGFDLRTFISYFSDLELYGFVDFSGTIQGDLKNPDFRVQGKAVESGYKFLRFGENSGTFEILNGQMRYTGHSPNGASYSDSVDVMTQSLFDGTKRQTTLKSSFNNFDISNLLENPGMTGKVSGTWDMQTWPDNRRSGKLIANVKDYHLYQFHIGDMETQGILEGQIFRFPELTFHPPGIEAVKPPRETAFTFNDLGFTFKGSPIAGMDVEGGYIYKRENVLDIKAVCRNCAVAPLLASLDQPPLKGSIDGRITMQLIMGNFDNSKMEAQVDRLEVPLGDGVLGQSGPLKITYRQGYFHLDQVSFAYNKGSFRLLGSYATDKPLDLQLKGEVDLSLLKTFREQIRDAEGLARLDMKLKGKKDSPSITGTIDFDQNTLALRAFPNTIEDLKGHLSIDDEKISVDQLQGSISDGDLSITGTVWRDHFKVKKVDLKIDAREIGYSEPGAYKLILSGKLTLTGEDPNILLAGNLDITEGRYVKNFDIREFILQPSASVPTVQRELGGFDNLKLDLSVKSPGELQIKNNIAEIDLKTDLRITGTKAKPIYEGAVEVLDGKFNYFRLNFENAKGYIDFRNPQQGHPYVDMTAQKLFERPSEDIQVVAHITGYTDNLQLSFTSDPPLEKREILALIFTGALPEERRSISGSNIASSVLASQLTSVLEQPVTGFTHLDIFRLEAPDPDSKALSSLVVGKKITERLSLEFKTDLNIEDSIKSVQAEYLLLDNVLLTASRSTTSKYRLEFTFRFRGY